MENVQFGKLTKKLLIDQIEKDLKDANHLFITQFKQIPTNTLSNLRAKLRKNSTRFRVIKNSLGRKAIEASPYKDATALVDGSCGLGLVQGDSIQVAKIFSQFAEENKSFKICGAYIDGESFSLDKVKYLATLPSKQELVAQAVGRLSAPLSGFVGVLSGVARGFVRALDQIRESKK